MSSRRSAAKIIAVGLTVSDTQPAAAGFVKQRASVATGVTVTSAPLPVMYSEYFSVSALVLSGGAIDWTADIRTLISSDGIDPADSRQLLNPQWSNWVNIVTNSTASRFHEPIVIPVCEFAQIRFTNDGASIVASSPVDTPPDGLGVLVGLHFWS